MSAQQLLLPVCPVDEITFANFFAGKNQLACDYLQAFAQGAGERYAYICGHAGVGCSHLLQASCHAARAQGIAAVYLSLAAVDKLTPPLLEHPEAFSLICLDDMQAVVGQAGWEEKLMHLYNRVLAGAGRLLIAANAVPSALGLQLPDLLSRLMNGVILQIQTLTDAEKLAALQLRANMRGFELPLEVGQFLLQRWPRNLSVLFAALEKLDHLSLVEQRRLTIPFVKQALGMVAN